MKSIILNIQRTCEGCIDLAMHIASVKKMGIPQNSRDAFELLEKNAIINGDLARNLKAMVGFRNIAVHNYQAINIDVIDRIINKHLDDMIKFKDIIIFEFC